LLCPFFLKGTALTKQPRKSFVQSNDFAALKLPRALAVSPDGRLIVYTLSWCDEGKKKYFANLHAFDLAANQSRQWTFGEHSDRNPVWSPDGTRLAFLRSDKGADGIYLLARSGGEPECVYKARGGFAQIKWAGEHTLIVKFRPADPDAEADKTIAEGKEPKAAEPPVRKIKRLYYRLDGDGYLPQERWQLFKFDLSAKKLVQLTRGLADVGDFDVSRDGRFAAYITNIHRDPDLNLFHMQILLLNLQTGKAKPLRVPLGEKDALAISPNGKYLVYIGHHNMQDAWGVETIHPHFVDLRTGRSRNLTPRVDRFAADLTLGDLGFGLGSPALFWSADSRKIYYQFSDEGDTILVRCGLRAGEPERVWDAHGQVAAVQSTGKAFALVHTDFETLGEIQFCADNTAAHPAFRKLITFNRDYFAARELGAVKEVHFKSGDGWPLQGWVFLPPRFSPRKKYPAILEVHGGPRLQYGRVFFHEMHYLAAQGFVVFMTNPRGSQGYGEAHAAATVAAWGTDDFNDIMAAADWLEAQRFVDKKRIGITGGSYGGYMTGLVVGRTRRFRAAVAARGVMDLRTMFGTSDLGWDVKYEFAGYPWQNPRGYEVMSPISYAQNVRTPLLILHNEGDQRCSIEQAEQFFMHIKIRAKTPVEFWRFPEESHGLSRGGRPDRRVIRLEGIAGWFKKWMR
jgi:dipeptidyl aminopeptidase/acylaminoacyl peptidase